MGCECSPGRKPPGRRGVPAGGLAGGRRAGLRGAGLRVGLAVGPPVPCSVSATPNAAPADCWVSTTTTAPRGSRTVGSARSFGATERLRGSRRVGSVPRAGGRPERRIWAGVRSPRPNRCEVPGRPAVPGEPAVPAFGPPRGGSARGAAGARGSAGSPAARGSARGTGTPRGAALPDVQQCCTCLAAGLTLGCVALHTRPHGGRPRAVARMGRRQGGGLPSGGSRISTRRRGGRRQVLVSVPLEEESM